MHLKIQTEAKCHKRTREKAVEYAVVVEYERQSNAEESRLYSRRKIKQHDGCARVADRITALYRVHLNSGRVTSNIKKAEIKSGAFDAPRCPRPRCIIPQFRSCRATPSHSVSFSRSLAPSSLMDENGGFIVAG